MATGNASPSNNGAQPLQSQAQKSQSIRWEQFTDIGLCILVCDCKVTDLLEWMFAHAFSRMSEKDMALFAQKLPHDMKDDGRLSETLKKTGLSGKKANELKDYIRKTMRLTLHELQCVVEALGEDKDGLVGKLRETRNDVVHKNYKFNDGSEREKFWAKYDEFIAKFDFEKYFGSSHAETKREECREPLLKHEELMTMQSKYRDIHKTLEKERAQWEERYNQLKRECKTLEVARDQLEVQVGTKETELEEGIADRNLLEGNIAKMKQQLSEKDKKINSIHKILEEERNRWREQAETRQAHNQLKEGYKTLEAQLKGEMEAKRLLEQNLDETQQQLSEKDREISRLKKEQKSMTEQLQKTNEELLRKTDAIKKTNEELQVERDASAAKELIISKLDQEMERLKYQARKDDSYITELEDENDDLKEKVETLEDQLSRCRCNMDQTVAQVQTGERVDRRHTF